MIILMRVVKIEVAQLWQIADIFIIFEVMLKI